MRNGWISTPPPVLPTEEFQTQTMLMYFSPLLSQQISGQPQTSRDLSFWSLRLELSVRYALWHDILLRVRADPVFSNTFEM